MHLKKEDPTEIIVLFPVLSADNLSPGKPILEKGKEKGPRSFPEALLVGW